MLSYIANGEKHQVWTFGLSSAWTGSLTYYFTVFESGEWTIWLSGSKWMVHSSRVICGDIKQVIIEKDIGKIKGFHNLTELLRTEHYYQSCLSPAYPCRPASPEASASLNKGLVVQIRSPEMAFGLERLESCRLCAAVESFDPPIGSTRLQWGKCMSCSNRCVPWQ